jgi:hypothetical protein
VVESIEPIELADVTCDLARESGFASLEDLLQTARHGRGDNVYLIRFHYLPPGGWDELTQERRQVTRVSGRPAQSRRGRSRSR